MRLTLLAIARSARPFAASRRALLSTILLLAIIPAVAQSDTLTARVAPYPGPANQVLKGSTHDLALLDIRTFTVKSAIMLNGKPDTADELLIVGEGDLNLTIGDSTNPLGPGGVALIPAGISYSIEAKLSTYYRFRFRSRHPSEAGDARKTPFILDWTHMPVQQNPKGETRQIFSQPTPWLSKIDLHATTLNPGEVSHLPHTHRAEEIILMRTGHVQMYINGKHYPATDGDLVFLPSGNPHALENHGAERCQYFALQWQQ
ncbi:MAG TPA: cupin domain-containing protein [Puia sp.]|jgi:(S)-ureidoglycine aminohydrolase|nr:cupin domain-containing protein [Puia sp.]